MRSTGEVLGLAETFGAAYLKAEEATQSPLPVKGAVLLSVEPGDEVELPPILQKLTECGFCLLAFGWTADFIAEQGYAVQKITDQAGVSALIGQNGVDLVIDTNTGAGGSEEDRFIRREAIRARIPYITTMAAAAAAAEGLRSRKDQAMDPVHTLQELQSRLKH